MWIKNLESMGIWGLNSRNYDCPLPPPSSFTLFVFHRSSTQFIYSCSSLLICSRLCWIGLVVRIHIVSFQKLFFMFRTAQSTGERRNHFAHIISFMPTCWSMWFLYDLEPLNHAIWCSFCPSVLIFYNDHVVGWGIPMKLPNHSIDDDSPLPAWRSSTIHLCAPMWNNKNKDKTMNMQKHPHVCKRTWWLSN